MYEELVKALRETDGEPICPCPYDNMCEDKDCIIYQAADAIEELQKPRWVPVTERLPEDRHDVLVYAGVLFPYITVGYYDGIWKFSFNDEEIAGSADYWMPLPEPPKEG